MRHFRFPFPPSANRYWRHDRGVTHRSVEADDFLFQAKQAIPVGRPEEIPMGVSIVAIPPDKRRRDLDNLIKITLDALQATEPERKMRKMRDERGVETLCRAVVWDDRWFHRIEIGWEKPDTMKSGLLVKVWAL